MGGLRILTPGMFTTVQDLGRPGWSASGVPRSGAADVVSHIVANRLVGNPDSAAGLEMTLSGAAIKFGCAARVAVCGGRADVTLDGAAARMWGAVEVRPGQVLAIGAVHTGARAYLSVAGGIAVPKVMGSRATFVAARFGGFQGRALRAGDALDVGEVDATRAGAALTPEAVSFIESVILRRGLRITRGPHAGVLLDEDELCRGGFTVSSQSDRVGVRLRGRRLILREAGPLLSEPMPEGAVQAPPSGEPIVLLADRPVTGGYPVIACIATADLAACGQLRPHESVHFALVSLGEAAHAYGERERLIERIIPRCGGPA